MPKRRPGPREAGFAALFCSLAILSPLAEAAADRMTDVGPRLVAIDRDAVADALGGELAALTAIAGDPKFTRLSALQPIDATQDREARGEDTALAVVNALHSHDAETARRLDGVQEEMSVERLLASLGAVPDGRALERVRVVERTEEWRCLAEAMYFEARGEGTAGQVAVAEVILNRVDSARYPGSVCDVVGQGAGNGLGACQFSYMCDGREEHVANRAAFDRIGKLAWLMLQGKPRMLTDEALYFHATSVKPGWARRYVRTAQIGRHIFYRPEVRLTRG